MQYDFTRLSIYLLFVLGSSLLFPLDSSIAQERQLTETELRETVARFEVAYRNLTNELHEMTDKKLKVERQLKFQADKFEKFVERYSNVFYASDDPMMRLVVVHMTLDAVPWTTRCLPMLRKALNDEDTMVRQDAALAIKVVEQWYPLKR